MRCLILVLRGSVAAFAISVLAVTASAHPITGPVVLEGTVVTPDIVIPRGKVVIRNDKIIAVGAEVAVPPDSIRVPTDGVIYPGLIAIFTIT